MRITRASAAIGLSILSGCDAGDRSFNGPPSVVLVLVDQLRHDAVRRWMPRLSALADDGVIFDNMRSAAPWTYPSVVSMFSGLYPQQHGADADSGELLKTFDEGVPLLPRQLRDTHYTAGFVTNPFFQTWNPLHDCFDHYVVDEFIGTQGSTRGNPDLVYTDHMFADTVNAAVIEHFDSLERTRPEFTYVHYIDVHGPWDDAPFDVGGANYRRTSDRAYEIATRFIDGKICELYDYFTGRYDGDLVFVVTSDHGQELGDDLDVGQEPKFRKRKATVHDFNTRIPFLILPSAHVTQARVLDMPCSNVDISPTILEWVNLARPEGFPGQSLLPQVRGKRQPSDVRPIYSLMTAFGRHNDCVVIGEKKLMRRWNVKSGTLRARFVFDLGADPREAESVSQRFGVDGNYLQWAEKTHGIEFVGRSEPPSDEDLEVMRQLGYFGDDE